MAGPTATTGRVHAAAIAPYLPSGFAPTASLTTFRALLCTAYFLVADLLLVAITFGISYGITYHSVHGLPMLWTVFDISEVINVVLLSFFMSIAIFIIGIRAARRRVLFGSQAPLASKAYTSNVFKRFFLFSLGAHDWRKRMALFIFQIMLFPTAFIVAGLAISCHVMKNRQEDSHGSRMYTDADGDSLCLMANAHSYVAMQSCYRAFLVGWIFMMSYLASHNDAQPDLIIARGEAAVTAAVIAVSEESHAANLDFQAHNNASGHSFGAGPNGQAPSVVYAIPMEMNVMATNGEGTTTYNATPALGNRDGVTGRIVGPLYGTEQSRASTLAAASATGMVAVDFYASVMQNRQREHANISGRNGQGTPSVFDTVGDGDSNTTPAAPEFAQSDAHYAHSEVGGSYAGVRPANHRDPYSDSEGESKPVRTRGQTEVNLAGVVAVEFYSADPMPTTSASLEPMVATVVELGHADAIQPHADSATSTRREE